MRQRDTELESEFETELELDGEFEDEGDGERTLRGLLGEGAEPGLAAELEDEEELTGEYEQLGLSGGPTGEVGFEDEAGYEDEGEEFFGRFGRRIGGFMRRAAPLLRQVAKVAAPMVGTALGGPLGGALGTLASSALGEGEYEAEFEGEDELEYEAEAELDEELSAPPATEQEALAELMAAIGAQADTEAEAEAMIGAATVAVLTPAERRLLRRLLPNLVRASCLLTRLLRRRRLSRPAVRTVPTIVHRTAHILAGRAGSGRPLTRRAAARVMAAQTRRVLANPRRTASVLQRNVRATAAARGATAGLRPAGSLGVPAAGRRTNGHHRPAYR